MRISLVVLGSMLVTAQAVAGQIVRGVVLEDPTGTPLSGAMVHLFEADSSAANRFLTDDSGAFTIQAKHPGRYFIRVDRIGYSSLTTELFDVPVQGTVRDVHVPIRPVVLRGLDVSAERRCEVPSEAGAVTARVWGETRKALEAAAWTQETGVYRYTLLHYVRELDRDAERIEDETRRFIRGSTNAPFASASAEQLAERGYVQQAPDSGVVYHAPDADAFLSDAFLQTHCMTVDVDSDGLVGLAFEPIRGRDVPEIEGVLWLDEATAQLDRLEFRYVGLADERDVGEPGGEVMFTRLPNGTWIVRDWWIRMPTLEIAQRGRVRRTGYRQEGGIAWRVTNAEGEIVLEASTATVSGVVYDSIRSVGVGNVRVFVSGTNQEARTASDGTFLLPGLPGGKHAVYVRHPLLDTLGLRGPEREIQTELGQVIHATLRVPRLGEALAAACGEDQRPRDTAPLLGRIVDATGQSRPAATVQLIWQTNRYFRPPLVSSPAGFGDGPEQEWSVRVDGEVTILETRTDPRGIFLLCDVPYGSETKIEAWVDGGRIVTLAHRVRNGADVSLVTVTLDEGR